MKALLVLLPVLFACASDTAPGGGGGGSTSSSSTSSGNAAAPRPENNGSMCDLYGTIEIELEDGPAETLPIPVMCDPYYHYEGYPSDLADETGDNMSQPAETLSR